MRESKRKRIYKCKYKKGKKAMQNKIPKNFRFSQETLSRLEELVKCSGKNCTEIIEDTIKYVHGESLRALKGKESDEVMLSQILGAIKPIKLGGV